VNSNGIAVMSCFLFRSCLRQKVLSFISIIASFVSKPVTSKQLHIYSSSICFISWMMSSSEFSMFFSVLYMGQFIIFKVSRSIN
uniref:Uncharacterized protein n=1 Tax=Amphimedon queenslandica TaxID=400682 RepID=A0A1X7T3G3_AMPQE